MTDLSKIINWRQLDDRITLSGQPTEDQLSDIKSLGVTHIVNLGPHTNKGALADEPGTVQSLGMQYIYIPVDFENPTQGDFDQFCSTMKDLGGTQIHVHCIYNARVSAFFYRYAKEGRGGDPDRLFQLMDGIWRPGGVWAEFIGDTNSMDQPNRYKGYEY